MEIVASRNFLIFRTYLNDKNNNSPGLYNESLVHLIIHFFLIYFWNSFYK